jgi:starvation-inducible DNA-binding protein
MKTSAPIASVTHPVLWNTHHDQPESRRVAVAALLNRQLADLLDLRLQAKQAHWNVKGPQFAALHALFDEVVDELDSLADVVAERAVVLGGTARGTLQVLNADSRLEPYPLEILCGNDHLWALSAALAKVAGTSRAAIREAETTGDAGTVDVLTQVSREVDTLLWKVEAHLPVGA